MSLVSLEKEGLESYLRPGSGELSIHWGRSILRVGITLHCSEDGALWF